MSGMTVTVLIPTYRRPELLRRTIRSVQAQTWRNLVIAIFDNASGDETSTAVASMAKTDSRILYHCHERNIGAAANFRYAIAHVATPLFCMVSDDDILLPHCLEQAVNGLRTHPQAMAWSGIVISATSQRATYLRPWRPWPAGFLSSSWSSLQICLDSRPETTGMVFRREVISVRFLGDCPDFIASDVGWGLEAAKLGGIGHTPEPSAVFYQHAGSLSADAGTSYRRALDIYWPSVRHLLAQFSEGCPLPGNVADACRTALRLRHGISNIRRLAAIALMLSDRSTLERCCSILTELEDTSGVSYIEKLRVAPRSQRRLVLCFSSGMSRLRRLAVALHRRRRVAALSAVARHYLRIYA